MIGGVYAIVDVTAGRPPDAATRLARELLEGGIRVIQLRAKALPARAFLALARELRELTRAAGAAFVVNDRPDIAVLAGAEAVHLGQDDLPAAAVRAWLPASIRIGVSCHDPAQARAAAGVADYIGYGPVFATATKANPDPVVGVDGLRRIRSEHSELPVVAIGGIDLDRLAAVKSTGVEAAAMISALTGAQTAARAISIWESS